MCGTYLHFDTPQMLGSSESSIDRISFTAARCLKRLCLLSPPTSVSVIPWLVDLTIQQTQTISMAVEVIQRYPRLESLSLPVTFDSDRGRSPTSIRSITQHDTLRRLHLYAVPYVSAVTDRLTLPALTDLSLQAGKGTILSEVEAVEADFSCSRLVDFFTRSNCGLLELGIRGFGSKFGPGDVLECLSHRSCQTLTHLALQAYEQSSPRMVGRELLIRMTYPDVDDDVHHVPLCPKLGHLELIECYHPDGPFSDLLGRMIISRCLGRTRDTKLRLLKLDHWYAAVTRKDKALLEFSQSSCDLKLEYTYR
ncbi:hypothetical protein JOM56_003131 [Amanita muscaria]